MTVATMLRSQVTYHARWMVSVLALAGFSATSRADITIGGDRPVTVDVPRSYDPEIPTPLLIELHPFVPFEGFSFWSLPGLAEEEGLLFALPTGMRTASGNYFWDATDACCGDRSVDDSSYLRSVIEEALAAEELNVDRDRIYVVGQSNGGFMAHRLACDHPELITAIAARAGVPWNDPDLCAPTSPVHVLHVHGTSDGTVPYSGGTLNGTPIPGAVETVERWAGLNGCSLAPESGDPMDLDPGRPGAETTVRRYRSGCDPGGSAELWTMQGSDHISGGGVSAGRHLLDYLLAHSKREPPVAAFTVSASEGIAPLVAEFDAGSSVAPDGREIARYLWDFGDGEKAEGVSAVHTYSEPGRRVASLTVVTDARG